MDSWIVISQTSAAGVPCDLWWHNKRNRKIRYRIRPWTKKAEDGDCRTAVIARQVLIRSSGVVISIMWSVNDKDLSVSTNEGNSELVEKQNKSIR